MSDSVPAGVDAPVVGPRPGAGRADGARPLDKAGAEAVGAALDADPVILRGAVAGALEMVTAGPDGLPWDELVARAAAAGGWTPERTTALADPAGPGHQEALWALATELIEDRGRDLLTIDLRADAGRAATRGEEP